MKTLHLSPRGPAKADGRSMTTGPESWHEANGHLILILSSTSPPPPPFPRRSSDAHHTSVQASPSTPYTVRTPFFNAQSTSYRSYQGAGREKNKKQQRRNLRATGTAKQELDWSRGVWDAKSDHDGSTNTFRKSSIKCRLEMMRPCP